MGQTSYWHCTNIVNNQTRDSDTCFFSPCKDFWCHLHLVQAVQVSNSSSAKSCDHISIEGTDCDIHWGWSDMALMVLLSKVIIHSDQDQVWQFELKILGCAQSFWYSWSILKTRKLFLPIILFLRHFASWRSLACLECHRKIAKNELSSDRD